MILTGKAVDCDPLPVGIVRKTFLGRPVATVREYSFCNIDEKTAVELGAEEGCGEAIEGHIKCDRFISSVPADVHLIEKGDVLYLTLATAPKTALLLSGCVVRGAGGEFFSFVCPVTGVHNTGGGTSDVREDFAERMRVQDRGGYTETEMKIYSDYERFMTYGYTKEQALVKLKAEHGIETPLLEATVEKVRACLK